MGVNKLRARDVQQGHTGSKRVVQGHSGRGDTCLELEKHIDLG